MYYLIIAIIVVCVETGVLIGSMGNHHAAFVVDWTHPFIFVVWSIVAFCLGIKTGDEL
jgi:hypothetical protein